MNKEEQSSFPEKRSNIIHVLPDKYRKILDVPYVKSTKHSPMTPMQRASQFSPFAAVAGYKDAIINTTLSEENRIDEENAGIGIAGIDFSEEFKGDYDE